MANNKYLQLKQELQNSPKKWLITGVAGFIGSNLLETLLELGQYVVGLDNLSTGHQRNLEQVAQSVGFEKWQRFEFQLGDIRNLKDCMSAVSGVDYVLHQAALGSVPRSIEDPIETNNVNVNGFLNMLVAARDEQVKSFTYAASSSTYGDHEALPKVEDVIGNPLSPYAVTKYVNELYASVFARSYGFHCTGLRYFNIFGKRQDPHSVYAAVIPKWVEAMLAGEEVQVNGDGETSRDFCFIDNAVQMNLLAATSLKEARNEVYNVAYGGRTSLNELFGRIRSELSATGYVYNAEPVYVDFRAGDVRHSHASIDKSVRLLGYHPSHSFDQGIAQVLPWYIDGWKNRQAANITRLEPVVSAIEKKVGGNSKKSLARASG